MDKCLKKHKITINNHKTNEIIKYNLFLLKGHITDICSCNKLLITHDDTVTKDFSILKKTGEFKILLKLNTSNKILLNYCDETLDICIDYQENDLEYTVQPIYIICKGHDGHFQSEPDVENNEIIACKKITLGIKLLQCLYAEKLFENTLEHKTFKLRNDCIVFNSNLDISDAKKMTEVELWEHFGREVFLSEMGKENGSKVKYIGFIGCTRFNGIHDENFSYENIKLNTECHVALGGDGLALFGTGCLYTWPTYFHEIYKHFGNKTKIQMNKLMDDSNYRRTYGGCFATTLGSVCHEIGHIFDLGHTKNGIMGNDFDLINRFFTINELTEYLPDRIIDKNLSKIINKKQNHCNKLTKINKSSINYLDKYHEQKLNNDMTYFTENCLFILKKHKWFNQFIKNKMENLINFNHDKLLVISVNRLHLIELRDKDNGMVIKYWINFINNYHEFIIPKCFFYNNKNSLVFITDNYGNILKC